MILGAPPDSTAGRTALTAPSDMPSAVSQLGETDKREASAEPIETPVLVRIDPLNRRWTSGDARKFRYLAVKRAKLEATAEEEEQFARLQHVRRAVTASAAGVDVLNEWRRRRFFKELLTVLNRNATFFTAADQEKLRTFRKTSRS